MSIFRFNLMRKYDFKDSIKRVLQNNIYDDLVWEFGEAQLVNFLDAVTSNALNRIVDETNKGASMDVALRRGFGYVVGEFMDHVDNVQVEYKLKTIMVEILKNHNKKYSEVEKFASFMSNHVSELTPF